MIRTLFFFLFPQTLNTIFQKCRGNVQPMGGLQIIFTGDFFQLPPVTKNKCLGENSFSHRDINSFNQSHGKKSSSISSYQTLGNGHPNIPFTSTSSSNSSSLYSQSALIESSQKKKSNSQSYYHYGTLSQDSTTAITQTVKSQHIDDQSDSHTENYHNNRNLISIQTDKKENLLYCFQSHIWTQIITSTFVLTNVFRQNDVSFSSLLNSIRCGELTGTYKLEILFFRLL